MAGGGLGELRSEGSVRSDASEGEGKKGGENSGVGSTW